MNGSLGTDRHEIRSFLQSKCVSVSFFNAPLTRSDQTGAVSDLLKQLASAQIHGFDRNWLKNLLIPPETASLFEPVCFLNGFMLHIFLVLREAE